MRALPHPCIVIWPEPGLEPLLSADEGRLGTGAKPALEVKVEAYSRTLLVTIEAVLIEA
mgnify:CR=1 FL=1